MRQFRAVCYPLLASAFVVCLSRNARADQVIVTVTGTVDSGTDGNPNSTPPGAGQVFGGGNLSGKPFSLTLTLDDTLGTNSFDRCPDGSVIQSSNTGPDLTTGRTTAVLQIGTGSYSFGVLPVSNKTWLIYRSAPAPCTHPYSAIGLGWSESYTGGYGGAAGFGNINLYASGVDFPSGDWRTSVAVTPVTPVDFQFNISMFQNGAQMAYASGQLKAATVAVSGAPLMCATCNQPMILRDGVDVTGKTVPVVVGERIALMASLPAGAVLVEQPWTGISSPMAVGGYVIAPDFSTAQVISLDVTKSSTVLYWIVPDTFTVMLSCRLSTGQVATSQVTFDVRGPKAAVVKPVLGQVQVKNNVLSFGVSGGYGITFDASDTPRPQVSGSFQWLQVIDTSTVVDSARFFNRICPAVPNTELDTGIPYPASPDGLLTHDSPGWNLPPVSSLYSKVDVTWSARMFFMWKSDMPAGCDVSGICKFIMVPLGYTPWQFTAQAKIENQTWEKVEAAESEHAEFKATFDYPTWNGIALPPDSDLNCSYHLRLPPRR